MPRDKLSSSALAVGAGVWGTAVWKNAGSKSELWAGVVALQDSYPYMRMPMKAAAAMRPLMIAAGLATEAELDDLLADFEERANDPETTMITFTTTQVWGRKSIE